MGFALLDPLSDGNFILRTSAAAAAALRGSSSARSPPPTVLPGPPTFGFELAIFGGTDALALLDGGGAEPRTRPGPVKLSFDSLPQRLPI